MGLEEEWEGESKQKKKTGQLHPHETRSQELGESMAVSEGSGRTGQRIENYRRDTVTGGLNIEVEVGEPVWGLYSKTDE